MPLFSSAVRALLLPALAMSAFLTQASVASAQAPDATPAMAATPKAPSGNLSPTQNRLTAGDKINVIVFGQADLTGEYVIDGAGNVTMPLAGPIPVADSTIAEAEQKIVARLSDGYIRQPSVSVRVSELRPIYVVGDVKLPGSYPYRFGATVLSAVAIAGGYGATELVTGTVAADFLLADERVRLLEQTRVATIVRQARVQAQLEGKDSFDPPVVTNPARMGSQLDDAVAVERAVLAAHIDALSKEIGLQQGQKPRIQAEITASLAQSEGEKKQLDLVKEQADEYGKLDKMGLTRRATEVSMQREKAALESGLAKLGAERARLDLMLGEVDIKIQDLDLAYKRRALAEMQEVRAKLQEIDTTLPSAREMRELRAQAAGGMSTDEDTPRSMYVMRTRNGTTKTMAATPETMLEPGDIVEVKRMRPRSLIGAKAQTSTSPGIDGAAKSKVADTAPPAQ